MGNKSDRFIITQRQKEDLYRRKLQRRKKQLHDVESSLKKYPELFKIFVIKNWFQKVEKQISIWESDFNNYVKNRSISIPEFELFRYFVDDDNILKEFIKSFFYIKEKIASKNQRNQWRSTFNQLFSAYVSQIYSSVFEILLLGKLIQKKKDIDIYYENIDGRVKVSGRHIYFEIKSLQKSYHDLEGIGAGSTLFDKRQIYFALKEKNEQLNKYGKFPNIIFLSLYRLADPITSGWYIPEYFSESQEDLDVDNKILSGVKLYTWFTARGKSMFYINPRTINILTEKEIHFLNNDI